MSDPTGPARDAIRVKLLRGKKVIRAYKVAADEVTIGTKQGCRLRMTGDPSLLPLHATLYQEEAEITLVPEPGAVITVNGEQVDFAVLQPTDVVNMGRLTFVAELVASGNSIIPKARKSIPPKRSSIPPPLPARVDTSEKQPGTDRAVAEQSKSRLGAALPVTTAELPKPAELPKSAASPIAESISPVASAPDDEDDDVVTSRISTPPPRADAEMDANYYFEDDDDDFEQSEFSFVEPFDLASELLDTKPRIAAQGTPKEPYCAAHIVRVLNGRVVEAASVTPVRRSYRAHADKVRCVLRKNRLIVRAEVSKISGVQMKGRSVPSSELRSRKGVARFILGEGDLAQIDGDGGTYRIEAYRPPLAPRKGANQFNIKFMRIIAAAVVVHVALALSAMALAPNDKGLDLSDEEEIFAEVKMEKEEFKKPEEKAPEPEEIKTTTQMAEKAPRVTSRAVRRMRQKAVTTKASSSVGSLLKVLSKGSGKAGASNELKDLVSNIDAVAAGGASSSFSIAGAIGSLPGGDVNIAKKGGGGAISTLSGEQVAGKGSKIAALAKGRKGNKVRGKVTKMSSGARVKGSLSKADITRVVNSHIYAVQACYEKALLGNPGLSGRIVFDWTVKTNGRVSGVRVRTSSLGSAKVAGCISKKIKGWVFPRPKGGDVTITYPFLFRSVSS